MPRPAVLVLALPFIAVGASAAGGASVRVTPHAAVRAQAPPAASSSRPPSEIPFGRLKADATIAAALAPGAVASDDVVWVPGRAAGVVVRIEAKGNTVGTPVPVGSQPCASLEVAFGSLWVPLCGDRAIARVDPKAQTVTATAQVPVASGEGRVGSAVGSLWVITDRKGVVSRIDPDTNAPVAEIRVADGAVAIAGGKDALWVTSDPEPRGQAPRAGRLTRVNPHNNEVVDEIAVGPAPGRLALGEGGVWVLNGGDGTVTRVDPETNEVVATIALGGPVADGDIAAGAGSVWVSIPGVPIIRIDPRTNRTAQRFAGEGGGAILVAHGSLWVSAGPQTTWRLDPKLVEAMRP